jgi:hypothetical protein
MSVGRRWGIWLLSLRRSRPAILAAALIAGAAAASPLFEVWDKAEVAFGFKPDALMLAQDTTRGTLSRQLMQDGWNRLFWMRRYVSSVEYELPVDSQNQNWQKYLNSLERWNTNLMVNIVMLRQYYDNSRARRFEDDIQNQFLFVHDCITKVRFRDEYEKKNDASCVEAGDVRGNLKHLTAKLDVLNNSLYCFASGLAPKGDVCHQRAEGRGWLGWIYGKSDDLN